MFDFDAPPSRTGTFAEKYTARKRLFGREDVLPFWVADMEFAVAPAIVESLAARLRHPVYGYTSVPDSLPAAIVSWNRSRYDLSFAAEAVTLVPGVMAGVSAALSALCGPGEAVIVQPPIYPPLMVTVSNNNLRLVENRLVIRDGRYRINFAELEELCRQHKPRALLLCSPHNPVGRVWSGEELARIIEMVQRFGMFLVSDEIHADIIYPPHTHISALAVAAAAINRVIVLNSASKSFNIAGLTTAYAVIPDLKLRTAFRRQLRRMNLHGVNLFGMTALEAAYTCGGEWLEGLLGYLRTNRDYMTGILNRKLPGLQHFPPEGTYLYWLDFNALGLSPREIREKLINEAGVGLNDGVTFASDKEGFWRFNFAVPRSMLEQGLGRIIKAFAQ